MADNIIREICDCIKNINGLTFYKLRVDGVCQFDEFLEEVYRVDVTRKRMASIIRRMEWFGNKPMPDGTFGYIEGIDSKDIFEFRKDNIRVYVKVIKPNVYIILGGYKNDQKKDIQKVKRINTQL